MLGGIVMKENNVIRIKICPICQKNYSRISAVSRRDNQTLICPDCGIREALESIGIKANEQEEILNTIHRFA